MAPSNSNSSSIPKYFLLTGLFLLVIGMFYGVLGGFQYLIQGFLKSWLSFDKVRPLHVSSVVFWIILGASGSVLTYMQEHTGKGLRWPVLASAQFVVFVVSIFAILFSYVFGMFGGREYWEFNPWFALPITIGWIMFVINFIASIGSLRNQPVYVWQWLTGVVFFLFTFLESYLWIIPYFRDNVINDMTVQWKAYGSMVGAWNMLIYGCSMFLLTKISGDQSIAHSRMAFALYFTGLFNLMFNWGHHIYTLPTHDFIKHVSYIVSMTELAILGRILWLWRYSLREARKHLHFTPYRLVVAADLWVLLTLALAIVMSVPAINVYTHGTHVTVAHTMGATIGINSFLLLAFVADIFSRGGQAVFVSEKLFRRGLLLANSSLFIFWISLIVAGVLKASWQVMETRTAFSLMMLQLRPVFIVFTLSGIVLMTGLCMVVYSLFRNYTSTFSSDKLS